LQMMCSAQTLKNWDADSLRDIAHKYETKENLSLDDAIYLLGLAKRARDGGPIINQRLKTLEKQRDGKNAGKGAVS